MCNPLLSPSPPRGLLHLSQRDYPTCDDGRLPTMPPSRASFPRLVE